jgi:hypothetical protein
MSEEGGSAENVRDLLENELTTNNETLVGGPWDAWEGRYEILIEREK